MLATNFSPINKSPVLAVELLIDDNVALGKTGTLESLDSNTPCNFITSGAFKEISSSWTLVPKTSLNVKPSFNVVVPIPDVEFADPTTVKVLIFFISLIFSLTLIFLKVAINLAALLLPKPLIVISVDPVLKLILSAESDSVPPKSSTPFPVLIKTYLSSSKGKNVSSTLPLLTAPVELLVIDTSNSFLITIDDPVRSTLDIFLLGRAVYKLLSVEDWNWDVSILKLEGLIAPELLSPAIIVGKPPSQIPATVVTPDKVNDLWETPVILA